MPTPLTCPQGHPVSPSDAANRAPGDRLVCSVCGSAVFPPPAPDGARAGSVRARPLVLAGRAWRWAHGNPAVAVLLTTMAALLLAGTAVSLLFAVRADESATAAARAKEQADANAAAAATNTRLATANEERAIAETERVRALLYAANFGRAQDALRDRRAGRVRELLAETAPRPGEPDLRGFEWFYLDRLLNGHKDVNPPPERPALFGPGGRWELAFQRPRQVDDPPKWNPADPFQSQTGQHELRVKDTANGGVALTVQRYLPTNFQAHAFARSSGLVAWASRHTVTFYDPAKGKEVGALELVGQIWNDRLEFTPDGKRLVAITMLPAPDGSPRGTGLGRKAQLEVWDVARKERLLAFKPGDGWDIRPAGFDLSTNGEHVALELVPKAPGLYAGPWNPPLPAGEDPGAVRRIVVWPTAGGKPLLDLPPANLSTPRQPFGPDGKTFVVRRGRSVALYDLATGQSRKTYGPSDTQVTDAALSPDGKTLALAESSLVSLYDVAGGELLEQFLGEEGEGREVEFAEDGRLRAGFPRRLKEWDPARRRKPFSADADQGFAAADSAGRFILTRSPRPPAHLRLSDGRWPVRQLAVWDASASQPRELFRIPASIPGSQHTPELLTVQFSPDGRRVMVALRDHPPLERPMEIPYTGELLLNPAEGLPGMVRLSANLSAYAHRLARFVVLDVPSGEVVLDAPGPSSAVGAAFSPDNRYMVVVGNRNDSSEGNRAALTAWDLGARPPVLVPLEDPRPALGSVAAPKVAFGPAGHLTAVLGPADLDKPSAGALVRWDLATGRRVFTAPLPAPCDNIAYVINYVVSPDGSRLANPGAEPGARGRGPLLWDVGDDGRLTPHPLDPGRSGQGAEPTELGFAPDGRRMVAFRPGAIQVWDLVAGGPAAVLRGAQGSLRLAAVSPDGRRLVAVCERTASAWEPSRPELRVWDLAAGQELLATEVPFPLARTARGSYPPFDGRRLSLFGTSGRGAEVGILDGSPPGSTG
jgi:WD40 repeat protein